MSLKGRVGIDLHVVDGLFQGSRTHVLEVFSRVLAASPDFEFFLFLDRPDALRRISPAFSLPNVHLVRMPSANPVVRLCWQLPRMQKRYRINLLHVQYILPFPSLSPCVVTIHDVLFERFSEYFPLFFRLRSRILIRLAARRAIHVFTVSEYCRKELTSLYGIDPSRISVIHNAVDREKYYPGGAEKEVIERRGLRSGSYILSVGRLEPRKNHMFLLKAYARLKEPVPPLVIVGQRHFGWKQILGVLETLNLHSRVILLDDVSDSELPAFYRHARLFVYPTIAEGFGIPILEAMASGTPVITSNTTSIPEVARDAAVLIDPTDIDTLVARMKVVLSDEEMRHDMIVKGLRNVELFRWDASAELVRRTYLRELVHERPML